LISRARERNFLIVHVQTDYTKERSLWFRQFERFHPDRTDVEMPFEPTKLRIESFASPTKSELVIGKTGFAAGLHTNLIDYLNSRGITNVLVAGLITSVCVHHTAFTLFDAGFQTCVIQDCCADRNRRRHDSVLFLYGEYMYDVLDSSSLLLL